MASKSCGYIASVIHAILGLALFCASVWLYVEVKFLTDYRNKNHYLLDFNVYWPQAIPWLFILTGFLVIGVSVLGFYAYKKNSEVLVFTHSVLVSVSIFFALAAAVIALVFIDMKTSQDFIKETIIDIYTQIKRVEGVQVPDPEAEATYANIERRFQCCGALQARDYKNWRPAFPSSCCDVYRRGFLDQYTVECDFANRQPNERHGCSEVITQYASIAVKAISAASLLTGVIGIIVLVSSVGLLKSLRRRQRPRNIVIAQEAESKKILL